MTQSSEVLRRFTEKLDEALVLLERAQDRTLNAEQSRTLQFNAANCLKRIRQFIDEELLQAPEVQRLPELTSTRERDERIQAHESFGTIQHTESEGLMKLVGSALSQSHRAHELRIYRARRHIHPQTHSEFFFRHGQPLLTLRMSLPQWLALLSNSNGVEVPCTLRSLQGVTFNTPPEELTTPLEQIHKDAQHRIKRLPTTAGFDRKLLALKEKIQGVKVLPKRLTAELTALVEDLRTNLTAPEQAAKFAVEQLTASAASVVQQAQLEVAAEFEAARAKEQAALPARIEVEVDGNES